MNLKLKLFLDVQNPGLHQAETIRPTFSIHKFQQSNQAGNHEKI